MNPYYLTVSLPVLCYFIYLSKLYHSCFKSTICGVDLNNDDYVTSIKKTLVCTWGETKKNLFTAQGLTIVYWPVTYTFNKTDRIWYFLSHLSLLWYTYWKFQNWPNNITKEYYTRISTTKQIPTKKHQNNQLPC